MMCTIEIDESFGCLRQSLSWQCHMVPTPQGGKPFFKVSCLIPYVPIQFQKVLSIFYRLKKMTLQQQQYGLGKNKCDLKKHFSPIVSSSLNMPNQNLSITKSNGSQRVRRLLCSPSISFLSFPFRARTWGIFNMVSWKRKIKKQLSNPRL